MPCLQKKLAASSHRRGGCKAHMHFGRAFVAKASRQKHPSRPHTPKQVLYKPFGLGEFTALKQACSTEYHRAQGAFKDSMIHGILQFTLPIAFRCVLHRWENQEIRCRKLCISLLASDGPTCFKRSYNHSSFFVVRKESIIKRTPSFGAHGLIGYSVLGGQRPCGPYGSGPCHSLMILLQVHLQKPCYDFYFL